MEKESCVLPVIVAIILSLGLWAWIQSGLTGPHYRESDVDNCISLLNEVQGSCFYDDNYDCLSNWWDDFWNVLSRKCELSTY